MRKEKQKPQRNSTKFIDENCIHDADFKRWVCCKCLTEQTRYMELTKPIPKGRAKFLNFRNIFALSSAEKDFTENL